MPTAASSLASQPVAIFWMEIRLELVALMQPVLLHGVHCFFVRAEDLAIGWREQTSFLGVEDVEGVQWSRVDRKLRISKIWGLACKQSVGRV